MCQLFAWSTVARRLAKLANAPFVKVEATKFTEVGYVGRDVESIVRDLVDVAIKLYREQEMKRVRFRAEEAAKMVNEDELKQKAVAEAEQNGIAFAVQLHSRSRLLELQYEGGESHSLSCEYLRVYSPSAEVLGHGPGQEVLQIGKLKIAITAIKPVGNYALQLVFDDGHDTGLYSWRYLYELGQNQEAKWQDYLDRMAHAGADPDPDVQVLKL